MAGASTPPECIGHSYAYVQGAVKDLTLPKPFADDGTAGNPVFEACYADLVTRIAAWCRLNDVHLLHCAWYGRLYSEIDCGDQIQQSVGFSVSAWTQGHMTLQNLTDQL